MVKIAEMFYLKTFLWWGYKIQFCESVIISVLFIKKLSMMNSVLLANFDFLATSRIPDYFKLSVASLP